MKLYVMIALFVILWDYQTHAKSALSDIITDKSDKDETHSHEARTVISDFTALENNDLSVSSADSYSLYKQLMEVKQQLTSTNNDKKEPAAVTTLKSALSLLYDSVVDGVFNGFFPHVERQRREASDAKKAYMDIAVTTIGAVMGKQNCSRMIACRTGRYVGTTVPSAGLMMMMLENFVPDALKSWFNIVKTASIAMGDSSHCDNQYQCSLV